MTTFRLPQQRDPNELVNRFVQTALAARQQQQNQSFQMQKSLIDMEAQQKRKELLGNAYKSSVDRIKSVYNKPSDEFNKEVEGEAMQYDMSAPEIAKAIRNNKRAEPKVVTRKLINANGQSVERLEKFDPFNQSSTPIPGSERVIDQNQKVVTAKSENGGIETESAVTLDASGNVKNKSTIGTKVLSEEERNKKEHGYGSAYQDPRYISAQKAKDAATAKALDLGRTISNLGSAIETYTNSGVASAKDNENAIIEFNAGDGKQTMKASDAIKLQEQLKSEVAQAKKQESEWQQKLDAIKAKYGGGAKTSAPSKDKVGKWDPVTKKIVYQ